MTFHDSGASVILLNKSVADALGYRIYGKQTRTTAGTYTSTRSIAPRIEFGGAVLENVAVMNHPRPATGRAQTAGVGLLDPKGSARFFQKVRAIARAYHASPKGKVQPVMHKVIAAAVCTALIGAMSHAVSSDELTPTHPIPDIVQRAAAVYQSEVRGVVGMQRHFTTVIHAGPVHHTEHSDSGFVMRDGTFTRIKYYQIADDGQPFTPQQTAIRESQTNRDWSEGKIFFKEPYDERFLGDYQYDVAAMCSSCAEGAVAVTFKSDIKDNQHGSGTMWIDAAGHVTKVEFSPNQLPPHANWGTVTETATEVMPGIWYVTQIQAEYKGRLLLLTGGATFTATFDHFHRFDRVGDADAALDNGSI